MSDDHRLAPSSKVSTRANRLRVERGLTRTQLATRCHLSRATIDRLMHGHVCAVRAHVRVAQELGADVFDLWPNLVAHPNVVLRVPKVSTRARRTA